MDERGSLAPVHNRGRKFEPVAASVHLQAPIIDNLYQDVREEPEHRCRVDEEGEERLPWRQAARARGELDHALEALGPRAAGGKDGSAAPAEEVAEALPTAENVSARVATASARLFALRKPLGVHIGASTHRKARLERLEAHDLARVERRKAACAHVGALLRAALFETVPRPTALAERLHAELIERIEQAGGRDHGQAAEEHARLHPAGNHLLPFHWDAGHALRVPGPAGEGPHAPSAAHPWQVFAAESRTRLRTRKVRARCPRLRAKCGSAPGQGVPHCNRIAIVR